MLAQMAATAGSVAVGSTIGHGLSNMLFGSSNSTPAAPEAPAAPVQQQQYQQPPQQYGQAGATPTAPRDMSASAVMNSGQGPRPLQSQQSLPSLKASGLLETWKPPADGLQNGAIPRSDRPPSGIVNHPHALGQPSQNGARHPATPLPAQNMAWTRFEGQ